MRTRDSGGGGGRRGEKRFGGKKFGAKKFGDKKFGEKKFGDRKFGEKKFGGKKFGEKKFGDKKFGGKPFGSRRPSRDFEHRREPPAPSFHPAAPVAEEPRGRDDLLYGINSVLEALRANPDTIERIYLQQGALNPRLAGELLTRASENRVRIDRVDRPRLDALAGPKHQGIVAEVHKFEYTEPADIVQAAKESGRAPLIVVLDGIQDPQNLGAIIRSAHAFGAHGVIVPKDRAAAITSVASKASAGAVSHTPIARVVNLARTLTELKAAGLWIVGAEMSGDREPAQLDLKGPTALVIGAEGSGIRQLVKEHCDFLTKIPMLGNVASLNASVSAGVLLYETARQRGAQQTS